jgi:tetratricopeptide (TPR) repeat protein
MKCLEKDRQRRYETANDLAADLKRHLNNEPVAARPPSTAYRFQKLLHRNKVISAATALVLTAILAGTVISITQALRAQRELRRALAAEALAQKEKANAQAREAETMAVLDFVENKVFAAARPEGQDEGLGHDISLRKAMEAALPFIESTLTNQPLIEARLRMTVGWSFWCVGEATNAAEQFQAARLLYTQHRGTNHPDTLRSMNNLANSYRDLGREAEALKLHQETLDLRKATLGPEHPDTLITMNNVAFGLATANRFDEAIQLAQETLTLRAKTLGSDHPHTLMSRMVLTRSYLLAGRLAESVKLGEETLALQRAKLGPYHPYTLRSMCLLGNSYFRLGRQADALKIREEVMPLMQTRIGQDNPITLWSMTALAKSYDVVGRHADAIRLLEETLAIQKARLGTNHADTIKSMQDLAWLLATCSDVKLRDPGRAVELAKSVAEQKPAEIQSWRTLTVAQYRAGNYGAVLDALNESMKIRGGRDRIDFLYLAMSHWKLGNKDEARQGYDRAVTGMSSSDLANESLTLLRREAAGLLQVAEK